MRTVLAFCIWLSGAFAGLPAERAPFSGASIVEIKSLVAPVAYDPNGHPSVIVRVDRVFQGYKRKGFFTIGAFPVPIAEGFSIQARDAEALTQLNLNSIRAVWGEQVQIRGFKLLLGDQQILQAQNAQVDTGGRITLRKGRIILPNFREEFDKATLWVGETAPGRLAFNLPQRAETNLFQLACNPIISTNGILP